MKDGQDGVIQENLEERARELARRVMGKPPEKQEWPKKDKLTWSESETNS